MKKMKYVLIGCPLGHSMSVFIHSALFKLSGINADYSLFEIAPSELPSRIDELKELDGMNVTIPHKTAIIPYLNRLDERAALYGAVNTVANRSGELVGFNTDCHGFLRALSGAGISLKNRAVVCGCGGAARMMAFECALAGCRLTVAVRETGLARAENLRKEILCKIPAAEVEVTTLSDIKGKIDLLINGTPAGMYPNVNAMPVSEETLSRTEAVFDAVYNPSETMLLRTAKKLDAKAVGGMPMLVWQAAAAQEIWNGSVFKPEDINRVITLADEETARRF